jgi:hypothetical protein
MFEHGQETFHSVHVESAQRVAVQAHRAGVERLAHVSGIGSDAASASRKMHFVLIVVISLFIGLVS